VPEVNRLAELRLAAPAGLGRAAKAAWIRERLTAAELAELSAAAERELAGRLGFWPKARGK
jgi:hypothetical protein